MLTAITYFINKKSIHEYWVTQLFVLIGTISAVVIDVCLAKIMWSIAW